MRLLKFWQLRVFLLWIAALISARAQHPCTNLAQSTEQLHVQHVGAMTDVKNLLKQVVLQEQNKTNVIIAKLSQQLQQIQERSDTGDAKLDELRKTMENNCFGTKSSLCPAGSTRILDRCFRVPEDRVDNVWTAADQCHQNEEMLAEIADEETKQGIADLLRSRNLDGEIAVFLGLNDLSVEGEWKLYNGSILPLPGSGSYTPLSSRVDNWFDAEHCSSIQPKDGYIINDIPCSIKPGVDGWKTSHPANIHYICEFRGTTDCAEEPREVVKGFSLLSGASRTYGAAAWYYCQDNSNRTIESKCYGVLGWDRRGFKDQQCNTSVTCPNKSKKIKDSCFMILEERVDNVWTAADKCFEKGSLLAEITDETTKKDIIQLIEENNNQYEISIFLGLNDLSVEGEWKLYNGTVLNVNNLPSFFKIDNWLDVEHCAGIQPASGYIVNDIPCKIERGVNDWPIDYPKDLPVLCQKSGKTDCSQPPEDKIEGFTLVEVTSLNYGKVAKYKCPGFNKTIESRCYGVLGWDKRSFENHRCNDSSGSKSSVNPLNARVSNVYATTVRVDWDAADDVRGYMLHYNPTLGTTDTRRTVHTNLTHLILTQLSPNTKYNILIVTTSQHKEFGRPSFLQVTTLENITSKPHSCSRDFHCYESGNNSCVSYEFTCDGDKDCPNFEDESIGLCKDGYTCHNSGKCIKVVTSHKSWSSAKQHCEDEGAHLVVIKDKEFNQFVSDLSHIHRGTYWTYCAVWIGLSQYNKTSYQWVTGEPLGPYHPWNDDEQHDEFGKSPDDQNSIVMWTNTHTWQDADGSNEWYFVCEK